MICYDINSNGFYTNCRLYLIILDQFLLISIIELRVKCNYAQNTKFLISPPFCFRQEIYSENMGNCQFDGKLYHTILIFLYLQD